MRTTVVMCALSIGAALALAGCDDDDEVFDLDVTGTLEPRWTIEGLTQPERCVFYDADRMRIVVVNPDGAVEATELTPCASFATRIVLREDTYTGTATFIDEAGLPVSQTLPIPAFNVVDDQVTFLTIAFDTAAMTL